MSADLGEPAAWRWAAARAAGTSHLKAGTPCQDAWTVQEVVGPAGSVLIALVADGAGSAPRSREGSRAVVRGLSAAAAHWFAANASLPSEQELRQWLGVIRGYLCSCAEREETLRSFAATVVGAFVLPGSALVFHVGDGACALQDADGWHVGSWPESGEYANMTFFITDSPIPRLRMTLVERQILGVALLTDGLEDLALDRVRRRAPAAFFGPMLAPVRAGAATGHDRDLSRALRKFLRSDRVVARTDDDKTLVLAALTQ